MPRRPRRPDTPVADDHVSETDLDVDENDDENDENTPVVDENAREYPTFAPVHRSSSVLALRTPLSHARVDHDTPLRDITDQFFHPPSPSPVRISKLKRSAPCSIEPPRRPKKPKSLAYPADPPNWLYSRSSSSLPPSSPLPPSTTNIDHRLTDSFVGAATTARYEYDLGTPSNASDSDPFGFLAVERALKATRAPRNSTLRTSTVKSPPRSTVLPSAPSLAPAFGSLLQFDGPVPTNNEDIDGLYADEPVAGPSHVHVPMAPLLLMNSDQPHVDMDGTGSQPMFPDPLRTPRKRRRRASPTPDGDPDSDEGTSVPSSPSPVKISVGAISRRPGTARSSDLSILKVTRAQSRTVGTSKPPTTHASRTKRVKRSYQDIPTPSSTPASVRRSSRQSTAPPTPVPPRRSKRQAVVVARAERKGTTPNEEEGHEGGQMKLRSRKVRVTAETKTTKTATRAKRSPSKPTAPTRGRKSTTTTAGKPGRGRPKGKPRAKDTKGKGKARPLESVLDLSDDTREVRLT